MVQARHKNWHSDEALTKLRGWARDGLTDKQIANNIGINVATLYTWKKKYHDIDKSLKKGKEIIDYEIENSLIKKAQGYKVVTTQYKMVRVEQEVLKAQRYEYKQKYSEEHPKASKSEISVQTLLNVPTYQKMEVSETVQENPPELGAIIFWLKNRMPEKYRDKTFRKLNEANTEKANADTEISKFKLKQLKDTGSDVEELLGKMVETISKESKKDIKKENEKKDK